MMFHAEHFFNDKPRKFSLFLASCYRRSDSMAFIEVVFANRTQDVPRGTSISNDRLE